MCRSRSFPPSSFHDIAAPCASVVGSAAVVPTVLLPVVPVVPVVVVVLERFIPSSMRALFNLNAPSLPRARQPVTVISRPFSCELDVVVCWLDVVPVIGGVVVCGGVVVVCAPADTANPN